MNGLPVGRHFGQVSMYVAQEEMFVPTLSCWETLHIHAALRNRSRASALDLQKRMQDVLSVMGLWRVLDTQVPRYIYLVFATMPARQLMGKRPSGRRVSMSKLYPAHPWQAYSQCSEQPQLAVD